MSAPVLALDFGTSNSAAAIIDNGTLRRLPIETDADTLPTAVFFPTDSSDMLIGTAAGEALITGEDGRYMRALKSILGTPLFHEDRLIGNKRRTLADIVTSFLAVIKQRAETAIGHPVIDVLSGRPVHFHSSDPERDARAEADLKACYLAAGFENIRFMLEPEAAARATFELANAGDTGLIVDIGGGTSDFSIFRASNNKVDILASHGIRLGGTDFDHEVSMAHVMPSLGHGGQLRRTFGAGLLPVPNAIYRDLATWARIPFLYARDTQRSVEDLLQHAVEPAKLERLRNVIDDRLGHELAFSVERGKIAANAGTQRAEIDMAFIEAGLSVPITAGSLNAALSGFRDRLREAIYATFMMANVAPTQVGSVILVGGSSLMGLVSAEAQAICPGASLKRSEAFTAVVDGLALATTD